MRWCIAAKSRAAAPTPTPVTDPRCPRLPHLIAIATVSHGATANRNAPARPSRPPDAVRHHAPAPGSAGRRACAKNRKPFHNAGSAPAARAFGQRPRPAARPARGRGITNAPGSTTSRPSTRHAILLAHARLAAPRCPPLAVARQACGRHRSFQCRRAAAVAGQRHRRRNGNRQRPQQAAYRDRTWHGLSVIGVQPSDVSRTEKFRQAGFTWPGA